jgi:LysM repeat protein
MIIDQLFTSPLFEQAPMASSEQLAYNKLRAQWDSYQTMTSGGGNTAVSRDPVHAAKIAKVPAELARMAAALKAKGIDAEAQYDALSGPAAAPVDANQVYSESTDPKRAKAERMIWKYFGQIYNYGDDDGLNYLDEQGDLWNQLMDKYNGEIDDIVAQEPLEVLMRAAQELKGIAGDMKYELDEAGVVEGEVTKNATGLKHRATDKYGAGDDEPHHYTGGRSGFSEPGKYARDLEHVNKQLVKDLDASMGISWKNRGPKGLEVDEQGMSEGEYDSRKPFGVRYKVFAGREGRVTTREYWTSSEQKLQRAVAKIEALDNFYEIDGYSYPKEPQGVAEGLTEMDKSQTPPGRDTGPREGPEKIAKPITKEKMVKHALDALTKSMAKKDDKKKDVKEANQEIYSTVPFELARTAPGIQMAKMAGQSAVAAVKNKFDDIRVKNPKAWDKAMQVGGSRTHGGAELPSDAGRLMGNRAEYMKTVKSAPSEWDDTTGSIGMDPQMKSPFPPLMKKLQAAMVQEGRVKELALDLKTMPDSDFMKKYGKAKAAIRKDMKRVDEATPAMPATPAQTPSDDADEYNFDSWEQDGNMAVPLKNGVRQGNLFAMPVSQLPPGTKIVPRYTTYQQDGNSAYPVDANGGIQQLAKIPLSQVPKGAKIVQMPNPGGNLYKDLPGAAPAAAKPATAKPATPVAPSPVSERKGTRRMGEARSDYTPDEMADMLSGKRSQKQIDADAERTRGPNKAPPTKESTQSRAKRLNEKLATSDTLSQPAAGAGISRLGKKDMEPKLDFRKGLVGDDPEFFEPDVRIGKPVEPDAADTDAFMSAVDSYGEQNPYMQSWGGKYADQDTRIAPLRPGEFNVGGTTWRRVEDPAAAPAKKEVQWIPSSEADSIASWKANNPGKSAADWGSIPAASKSAAASGLPKMRFDRASNSLVPVDAPPALDLSPKDKDKFDRQTRSVKPADGSGANPNIDAATRDRARAWAAQQNAPVDTAKKKADWKTIYNLNKSIIGDNPNLIKPGMKLKMPDGSIYPVQPGDNLSKIAAKQSQINEQAAMPPDQAARLAPYLQKGADGSQYYNLPTTNPGETGAAMGQTNISPAALAQIKSPQGQQGIIKQLLAMTEPKNAVPQATTTATDVSGQYSGGLEELSTNQLARYKTAAAKDAKEADKEGDFKRGDKRFHGIVQATKKQFDNDAKKVDESRAARRALMAWIANSR